MAITRCFIVLVFIGAIAIVMAFLGSFVFVFFPEKVHVYIKNEIEEGISVHVHCNSQYVDLQERILAPSQTYKFEFHVNFFGTTKFWCRCWYTDEAGHLKDLTWDIYNALVDMVLCGKDCPWYIRSDGLYFEKTRINRTQLGFSWPKPFKRRRLEADAESESCKRCNCKKSKSLKLYCECFAAGVYCVESCSCQDCFNKPIHEDTVLAIRKQIEPRNPLAFAPKVIRANELTPEIGEEPSKTPASARHKSGCNCKKSSCLKKYCECYQGGVGCSINCRCEGCKNAFGRKDGTMPTGAEEAETCEKSYVHKGLHISELQKENDEHHQDHAMPITPFQICRMSVQLEFSSVGKPPRPMFHVGSSPRPHSNRAPKISEILATPLKLEDHFQVLRDDETPEILSSDCSPIRALKTSPNRRWVSPPHREHALSPGRRNSRKLILQSIPALRSLAYHETGDQQ